MAKVKIQGNASGTGTVTLTAPNTNLDRTITLPDSTGTVLMSDGDGSNLSNVGVDGIVSSANATAITIDSSERVGIGVTPNYKLNIHETGSSYLQITNGTTGTSSSDGAYLGFANADNTLRITNQENGGLRLSTNNTERLFLTNDGRGLSQFTAKAWVNFNASGTVAIRDSHNVSSITDNGTGDYTVSFSNSLANTTYYVTADSGNDTLATTQLARCTTHTRATGSYKIGNKEVNSFYDREVFYSIVFGD